MRTTSMILGLLGSVAAMVSVATAISETVASADQLPRGDASMMAAFGLMLGIVIVVCLLGVVGTMLSHSRPGVAGALMLVSGVLGFVLQVPGYVIAGPLFVIAAVLAFLGRGQGKGTPAPTSR